MRIRGCVGTGTQVGCGSDGAVAAGSMGSSREERSLTLNVPSSGVNAERLILGSAPCPDAVQRDDQWTIP